MDQQEQLIEAIKVGEIAKVKQLIDEDAELVNTRTTQGLSAVLLAAYYQEPEIATLLASHRTELDIFEASAVGDLAQVRQAIHRDVHSVNAFAEDGFQPLGLACFFGQGEVVTYLLGMGAEVNSPSKNNMRVMPLHSAVARRNMEITRLLLAAGAEVNAIQADDFSPLHEAAQNGQLEMVKLLIEYGADPQQTNKDGKNALQIAGEHQHSDVVQYLTLLED